MSDYSPIDRQKIMLRAKKKIGKGDYSDFMEECVADLQDAGVPDAEEVCQMIWDEGDVDE